MNRRERLERFVINHQQTAYIYKEHLESADIPEKEAFANGYHGDFGPGWEVSSSIQDDDGELYLQLECTGEKWNDTQRLINNSLQFIPTPDLDLYGGRFSPLVVRKKIIDQPVRVGNTQWELVYCRLQKSPLQTKDGEIQVNDVILTWGHPEWPDYMISCWKWFEG